MEMNALCARQPVASNFLARLLKKLQKSDSKATTIIIIIIITTIRVS